jgi:FkbM family methyltransferase
MLGLKRAKDAARGAIARHRRSPAILELHRAAAFVESAWHNEGAEFAANGERFVLEALRPAGCGTVFDVGANVGHWTQAVLELWPDCRVDAFEVAPVTVGLLQENIAQRPYEGRVRAHALGLSEQPGRQTMHFYPGRHELTSDSPRHDGVASVPFEARLSTVDRVCQEQGIERLDDLKIDVEGAEYRVLKGAAGLLEAGAVTCIQFEYGAFAIDTRVMLRDYFTLLGERFQLGKIYPNYVEFGSYDWRADDLRFCNYLCVSRDRMDLHGLVSG